MATPSVLPTATPSPTPAPTPAPNNVVQLYQWLDNGKLYQFQLTIPPAAIDRYRGLPHGEGSDYAAYAITALDRPYLPVSVLSGAIQSGGLGEPDAVKLVQSLVLSLQMTPGVDGSPKYPVETLLDQGGDSEDGAILAAALLNDLGYDAVILGFPGHMAVGVKGSGDLYGRYYNYGGGDYYYLETAIPGYDFGAIPDEYRNVSATIYPMSGATLVSVTATVQQASEEALYVDYKVDCQVRNAGTKAATGVTVHITALALAYGPDQEWPMSPRDVRVGDLEPGASRIVEATVKVPRSGDTQIACIVSGDNFSPAVWKGEPFTL